MRFDRLVPRLQLRSRLEPILGQLCDVCADVGVGTAKATDDDADYVQIAEDLGTAIDKLRDAIAECG
jgi:hypothetical protein